MAKSVSSFAALSSLVSAPDTGTPATGTPATIAPAAPVVRTVTLPKGLSMASVKAALPDYFGRTTAQDVAAITDKNQRFAPLAATLAGYAVEVAASGNKNGLLEFRATIDALVKASKGGKGSPISRKLSLCAALFDDIKGQSLKGTDVAVFADYALDFQLSALAILSPVKAETVKAPAVNWKQKCMDLQAELDATKGKLAKARAELAALKG